MKDEKITVQFDGGSRGNPGPAGIGIVLRAADGTPLVTLGRFIGRATNNVAEYRALIAALQEARKLGARRIAVRGDSELIIRQLTGQYRVKSPDMKPLYEEAQALLGEFESSKIEHTLRGKNELADKLANRAMDTRRDVTELDSAESDSSTEAAPRMTRKDDVFACPRCGCRVRVVAPTGIRPHQLKPFVCQCGNKMHLAE
jgi:ribonuclease HI